MSEPQLSETLTLAGAINAGLRAAMERDPKVLLMGEDIGALGGVFRVTDGLLQGLRRRPRHGHAPRRERDRRHRNRHGDARLHARGGDPVRRLHLPRVRPDHHVARQAALRAQAATSRCPLVIRVPYAGGIGAIEHHSESPEALFAHTAGLRIVTPATPQDGFDMIQQAIASPDPVLFFEPKARYWDKGEVDAERVAAQLDAPDGALVAHRRDGPRAHRPGGRGRHLGGVRPHGAAGFAGRGTCRGGRRERRGHRPALAVAAWTPTRSSPPPRRPAASWSSTRPT